MKWTPAEWCLFILTLTIPTCIIGLIIIRMFKGPISETAGPLITDMLKVIGGGVIALLGNMLRKEK